MGGSETRPYKSLSLLVLTLLTGCRGAHSALDPAGPQSGHIAKLWWIFLIVCTAVYVITLVFLLIALFRRRPAPQASKEATAADPPITHPDERREHRMRLVVGSSVGISAFILIVLAVSDFVTGRAIHKFSESQNYVSIAVTAHQWWWEVRYDDVLPVNTFSTANEIHIPVGRPVKIFLNSGDVIHSFWVPNLHGKKDMIPNHTTFTWLQADKPGVYYGQCAEFCGYEHAKMRLVVQAEPQEQFDQWLANQRTLAPAPSNERQRRGQEIFFSKTCVMCHAITGTPAGAHLGPDLTHVASRSTLAAGSINNTTGNLAGWIIDPQRIKPGVHMPQNTLNPDDLRSLLEYLESLK